MFCFIVIFDSRDKQSTVSAENVTKIVIDLGTKEVAGTKSSDQVDQQQTTAAAENSQESKAFIGEKCEVRVFCFMENKPSHKVFGSVRANIKVLYFPWNIIKFPSNVRLII